MLHARMSEVGNVAQRGLAPLSFADSIVTRSLSFVCDNGCLQPYNTAPTSGSFTYDKASKQFLSFNVAWDGFNWSISGLGQANYLALIGNGPNVQKFFLECVAGSNTVPDCDQTGSIFEMFLVNPETGVITDALNNGFIVSGARATNFDSASGIMRDPPLLPLNPQCFWSLQLASSDSHF
jgi:hypothetical protein